MKKFLLPFIAKSFLAEVERFERSIPCGMPPFQGGGINHYPTPPLREPIYNTIYRIFQKYKILATASNLDLVL